MDRIYNPMCQEEEGAALCVGPGQLCDGVADCGGGEDEAAGVCAQHECGHGVRCARGDTCLYTPHTQLCTGRGPAQRDFVKFTSYGLLLVLVESV